MNNRNENNLTVTVNDYQRLMGFVELASLKSRMPIVTDQLVEKLNTAQLLPQKQIAKSIITMNSRVKLRDVANQREAEITITYPQEAEPREARVSVFSEIGLALIGRKESDIVSWRVPNGIGHFQVEKVLYQPEAAGDYFL
jgi:regulator of nucleoside diphosphate kinase